MGVSELHTGFRVTFKCIQRREEGCECEVYFFRPRRRDEGGEIELFALRLELGFGFPPRAFAADIFVQVKGEGEQQQHAEGDAGIAKPFAPRDGLWLRVVHVHRIRQRGWVGKWRSLGVTLRRAFRIVAAFMSATEQYIAAQTSGSEDVDVPMMVNYLIQDSVAAGASDIHIEPWEDMVGVRIRVNGELQWLVGIPSQFHDNICGRFKVMANMKSHVKDMPQDGKAAPPEFKGVQLRVSIFPTVYGEKIVCRIFNPEAKMFDITNLGFDDVTLEKFKEIISKPTGLILLTGPTGSGKTTAIYAAIGYIIETNGNATAVSSVEDPVEQNLDWVNQSTINVTKGYGYPEALRSLMRQDPEVIMVGEIRDLETAEIAINAGMTGHLVISTLHSGTTSGTFARLMNMDIEPFLLASTVIGVLGVRLLRQNCIHCSAPYQPEAYALEQLRQHEGEEYLNSMIAQDCFYQGTGCSACSDTGFGGRSSITEMLVCDEGVREAVMHKKPTRDIQEIAVNNGMTTLWDGGLQMVVDRKTTLEEILQKVAADQV